MTRHNSRSRRALPSPTALHPLKASPAISGLVERGRFLARIQSALADVLDSSCRERFRVANLRDRRLVLLAPTAAIATRLRLSGPQLLDRARKTSGLPLDTLAVELGALPVVPADPPSSPLSAAAADTLDRAARVITDPALRALLERLASLA